MNTTPLVVLLAINLAATAGLGAWALSRPSPAGPVAPPAAADLSPALAPLAKIPAELRSLNTTLQRLNTSLVQYQFLDEEQKNLATLERALAVRAQAVAAAKDDKNGEEVDKALEQLKLVSAKAAEERNKRRQTTIQLIAGLERQLAGLSGSQTVTDKVPAEPVPVPTETASPSAPDTSVPATADE